MCIVALAWQVIDGMPLCLISNRDEYYQRPTQALKAWDKSNIIAGQDLEQGGTWMGVTKTGRWAVITNFRDGQDQKHYPTSRGHLVSDFLQSDLAPIRFAKFLEAKQCDYAGFNIFMGDQTQAVYMSNRGEAPQVLAHGVYVVSNALMHEPWEKTRYLRKRFTQELLPLLQQTEQSEIEDAVWDILQDQRKVPVDLLPNTGISSQMEQLLSSTFIESAHYGTRCCNFLTLKQQTWHWLEKDQTGKIVPIQQVLT
ncbi:NRDE family protein [uncultured Acinetobacter sp.]|uniref:NRDE family protein n=1 Tax=uncultured Acinetobacter sp. TaxID=165433 RepID=UPI0026041B26|nr:NRDE family protein [uncultured Acinetobacter sp.]